MSFRDWAVWQLDVPTLIWLVWIVAFFVMEWLTSGASPIDGWRDNMLTDHLRPLILSAPIIWFVVAGLLAWLPVHFLAPRLEAMILRFLGGA